MKLASTAPKHGRENRVELEEVNGELSHIIKKSGMQETLFWRQRRFSTICKDEVEPVEGKYSTVTLLF